MQEKLIPLATPGHELARHILSALGSNAQEFLTVVFPEGDFVFDGKPEKIDGPQKGDPNPDARLSLFGIFRTSLGISGAAVLSFETTAEPLSTTHRLSKLN